MTRKPITRALLSVYDKTGIAELAAKLHGAGVELLSTGSTASVIGEAGTPVVKVEDVTNFPECLDGRVKTLHPAIHAGILADRDKPSHREQLSHLDISGIDLVVVNLYPFSDTVASGASASECIEKIDIGGPTMVRAAAKNFAHVTVVVNPARYDDLAAAVAAGGFTLQERRELATAAFEHTAAYDVAVASWMGESETALPSWIGQTWRQAETLRYGENPHQQAALYTPADQQATGLAGGKLLGGKAMSYNNYVDADAAWRAAWDQGDQPTCAIIKHANPCGIAVAETITAAHRRAHACDPLSAFGGIIAVNREVDAELAEQIKPIFTEVVLAPAFSDQALSVLGEKKNLRLVQVEPPTRRGIEFRPIDGGLLAQQRDLIDAAGTRADGSEFGDDPARWQLVAGDAATGDELADLVFAWRAVRAVKSNAILLASDGASVGVGMGQVNRVDAAKLAVERANILGDGGQRANGAVAASDAFFPFADGLQVLTDAGVRAVVAPGGSLRDEEVIAAAKDAGITLYFTGVRHFFH